MCFSCYRSSWRLCPLRGFSGGTSIFSITFKRTSSTASVGRSSFNIWFRLSFREWKITPHSYLSSSRVTLPSLNRHTSVLSFLCRLPALPVSPWLSGFPVLHMRPALTFLPFWSVLPVLLSFLPLPRLFLLSLAHAVLLKHFRHTGRDLIGCVTGFRQLRPHFLRLHPLKEIGRIAEVICLRIDPILFTEQ